MSIHKDQRFVDGLAQNDNRIIAEIYSSYSKQIIQFVQKNSGSESDAKDVFQEALITIYTKAKKGDLVLTCPFGAFLYSVCRNKWWNRLKKNKSTAEVRIEEIEQYSDNEGDALQLTIEAEEASAKQSRLKNTFAQLSELCQKLLTQVSEGLSPNDIASKLGMDHVNTFYRRKNACKNRWSALYKAAL